jgi:hypothetical protein
MQSFVALEGCPLLHFVALEGKGGSRAQRECNWLLMVNVNFVIQTCVVGLNFCNDTCNIYIELSDLKYGVVGCYFGCVDILY